MPIVKYGNNMPIVKYGKKKPEPISIKKVEAAKDSKVLNKLKGMTKKKG